ncbi:hypothetical protein [Microbacterium sp.]|uniref:hypothetical protein n=1 Tax=Microbacterium sp. TaxID=51671 RepID=UPI003F70D98B
MEEPWVQEAADALEKITRDPMADAVAGTARVLSVSAPRRRGRYQECDLELLIEVPGREPRTARAAVVFSTRTWPTVGAVLPARVSTTDEAAFAVKWDALRR